MSSVTRVGDGLPPCYITAAIFEGRQATLHDLKACQHPLSRGDSGFYVCVGRFDSSSPLAIESNLLRAVDGGHDFDESTDDLAEAKAAFERGERWVRTGELDG